MSVLATRAKKDDTVRTRGDDDEDGEGEVLFDQNPVRVVCPHCGLSIITFIEHESSWVTYAVSVVLLLVLNWAALCVVPVVYPLFKDVVHHCPRCLSVLATRSRVALPSWKQEVMSFRFGSCVVVLARKYVLMLVALTTIIWSIHWARSSSAPTTGVDAIVRSEVLPATWEEFLKDCGLKSYLGNPIHVTLAFNEKYKNKTFHWEGSVHHVEEGLNLFWWSQRGALFAQMDPPQFPKRETAMVPTPSFVSSREVPDLVLLYEDSGGLGTNASRLRRGAHVSFEATMVEVGRRGSPHVMLLWELQALPGSAPHSGKSDKDPAADTGRGKGARLAALEDAAAPLNATAGGA